MSAVAFLRTRPRCAVCARPVDSLEEQEHFGRVRLIARCHGEREAVELDERDAKGLIFGAAFTEPRRLRS